jgi:colanic acid/amylovoran biosynthesis glycosyltransferase
LKIAYLINEYPKVSHSFIRREILALERQGLQVQRIAVRGWSGDLPDAADQIERSRTQYVLQDGAWALCAPGLRMLLRSPVRFVRALRLALRMAHDSDRGLAYHLAYLLEACRILPWLRASGARRLHAHFGTNSTDVALLTHALGGPAYSFTVHGPEEFLRPVGLREKIRRASFVVAISQFGRSQLLLWARYPEWGKVEVVHCGLEESFYADAPTAPATGVRFVCVGRLTGAKGQALLIEAAAALKAESIAFEVVLAGDGPMRSALEQLIRRHDLEQRVRITGWISGSQVRAELLAARALVLPSFAEGLPVVIMEAMALRRPVLTTFVAGIPELVRHGEEGWLFPAGSALEIARAMKQCLATPADRLGQMGETAFRRVTARHSVDIEAAKLATLFRTPAPGA